MTNALQPSLCRRTLLACAMACAATGLPGCASTHANTPRKAQTWTGRLGLVVESEPPQSFAGGFELTGTAATGALSLFTPLGSQVAIAAESFGTEPTEGELIAATRTRYTLRRTDPRAGTVHVHFPRIGYTLRKVEK